jgi:hypothetical protein
MIASLLGTILAFAGAPQNTETMRVTPMSEESAVGEFENACIKGVRDPNDLAHAASASIRNYVEQARPVAGAVRSWSSPYGTINYVVTEVAGRPPVRECSFTAFTRESVNRRMLDAELASLAHRRASEDLREYQEGRVSAWSWRDADERIVGLYSVADPRTPHQITLSLRMTDSE